MNKLLGLVLLFMCTYLPLSAQSTEEEAMELEVDSVAAQAMLDSLRASFEFQTGEVEIEGGFASINVPKGFKYLDAEASAFVLHDLWGNPESLTTLGMIFLEEASPVDEYGFAFNITFDEIGYVKDADADDIDYDVLLEDMQSEIAEASISRVEAGYESLELVGWASEPFYDSNKKVLHWAKELKFGGQELNTLNYDVRVLGRKGVLSLNAISTVDQLSSVKENLDPIIASVQFKEGHKYSNFNPSVDEVAAYTIGGLVAGKVLAKVGFFALLLKFWKIIVVGFVAAGGFIWRIFSGGKKEDTTA